MEPSLYRLSLLTGLGWQGGLEKEAPILAQNGELFQRFTIIVCIVLNVHWVKFGSKSDFYINVRLLGERHAKKYT